MNILLSLFFSLVLTSLVSFAIPIVFLLFLLGGFYLLSQFDLLSITYENTRELLGIFGDGSVSNGILTIGIVCAVAGLIFESLNFYRYQTLIAQNIYSSWESHRLVDLVSKVMCSSKH
jgi:hypothetical protein